MMNKNVVGAIEDDGLDADVDRLGDFIQDRFPEEATNADLTDRKEVVRLALELLDRLWRWEH